MAGKRPGRQCSTVVHTGSKPACLLSRPSCPLGRGNRHPGLPVLSGVFGGFFFKHLPKHAARFILVFHVILYGLFLLTMSGSVHYLWAISLLLPMEFLILYVMNRINKSKQLEPWVQKDVQAVDLTPWKYRWVMAAIVFAGVLVVYVIFPPLGIVRL